MLHAGYPRLSSFIGDYSSVFGKENQRGDLADIEATQYAEIGFVIFHPFPLFLHNVYLVDFYLR